jgi:hypothetical protein
VLLFGYFLLHEQEKGTRSPDASGNAQDASTILRTGQTVANGSFASQVTRAAHRHAKRHGSFAMKVAQPAQPHEKGRLDRN